MRTIKVWNTSSIEMCLNNDEEDTIVGNFTGKGIDTLYVEEVMPDSFDYHNIKYYMVSSNNYIPVIELYGIFQAPLKLVNEGRLGQERNLRSWLPTYSVQQPMATRQKQLMGVFLNIFAQKYKEK